DAKLHIARQTPPPDDDTAKRRSEYLLGDSLVGYKITAWRPMATFVGMSAIVEIECPNGHRHLMSRRQQHLLPCAQCRDALGRRRDPEAFRMALVRLAPKDFGDVQSIKLSRFTTYRDSAVGLEFTARSETIADTLVLTYRNGETETIEGGAETLASRAGIRIEDLHSAILNEEEEGEAAPPPQRRGLNNASTIRIVSTRESSLQGPMPSYGDASEIPLVSMGVDARHVWRQNGSRR
ncbi:MAG: hypothetical protein AB7U38_14205, partial [Hyphomicrobiales bacterium]